MWLGKYFVQERTHHRKRGSLPDLWARDLNVFCLLKPLFYVFCAAVSCIFIETLTSSCLFSSISIFNSAAIAQGTAFLYSKVPLFAFPVCRPLVTAVSRKKNYCKNKILVSNVLCLLSWPQSTLRESYRFLRNSNTAPHMGDWCSSYELRCAKEKLLFFYYSLTSPISTKWEKTES